MQATVRAMTSKHTLASSGIAHHFEELQGIFSVDDFHHTCIRCYIHELNSR